MTSIEWWRSRAVMVLVPCLLLGLAACGRSGPAEEADAQDPAPTSTTLPPPLQKQPAASDGGTVEIGEAGFTVIEVSQYGRAEVVWAAELENTSDTDLLAYVDVELHWSGAEGETEVVQWHETAEQQRAYDVLPGTTAMIGGGWTVGDAVGDRVDSFVPDRLDVKVNTQEWYPMRDLEANDIPVGFEVTDWSIEEDYQYRVQVEYISSYGRIYDGGDEDLRLLVVARDASGALVGAIPVIDFAAGPPGERERVGFVLPSRWPEEADLDSSEARVTKACCTWVGGG